MKKGRKGQESGDLLFCDLNMGGHLLSGRVWVVRGG